MMYRNEERLWKLIGNDELKRPIPSKSIKSVEAELKYYRTKFEGSKTKCVRNRTARLTDALDILVEREFEKGKLEKLGC